MVDSTESVRDELMLGDDHDPWMRIVEMVTARPDWDEEQADGPADIVEYLRGVLVYDPELPMLEFILHVGLDDDGEPVWWTESEQLPGYSAAAPSLKKLRKVVWSSLVKERLAASEPWPLTAAERAVFDIPVKSRYHPDAG